jgi:hypothetical protein
MKYNNKYRYIGVSALVIASLFMSCDVDTLKEVKDIDPVISLVQVGDGSVLLNADDLIVDKQKRIFKKGFGLTLSGFQGNKGFSAELELDYSHIPEGSVAMTAAQCFLTASSEDEQTITSLSVPAGVQQKVFYLNITEDALLANDGKIIGVKLKVKNPNAYRLNPLDSANITLNTVDFASKKIDITYDYFLNITFGRDTSEPNERFDNLKSWIANDAVALSRPAGAGYDDNAGFMGIERWGSWDPEIVNGKIYQTFRMSAGRYSVEVQMRKIDADPGTYFVVAPGTSLPDASNIGTAINAVELSTANAEKLVPVEFSLNEEKEVAIGFLVNLTGVQKIIQASGIKMYRLEGFFD